MSFRLPKFPLLTIFHNPTSETSSQALKLLRQASVNYQFDIDIVDAKTKPTHQQVSNIISYLGKGSDAKGCSEILTTDAPKASTVAEVQKILDANPGYMKRPLVVDWNKGKAIVAVPPSKVSEIVKDVGETEK
ncbi:hypothetical protein BGX27_007564 [Mortierella sp. AM989]|nr:hypothetical protein BGX27_007564 [Mortierella sp. AM989]